MYETKKLGKVLKVRRGTTITKRQTIEGEIPVIGGGIKPTYYHNVANRKKNCITVSGSGASAGFVNKWNKPIILPQIVLLLNLKIRVNYNSLFITT